MLKYRFIDQRLFRILFQKGIGRNNLGPFNFKLLNYLLNNKTRAVVRFIDKTSNENNTRCMPCTGDRARLLNDIIGTRKRRKSQRKIDRSTILKKKRKKRKESVITFDKLFKGMLNPRAIMPRSNLINFRSIIGFPDSSRLFFEPVFRNNFRFNYRYAIKKKGGGK